MSSQLLRKHEDPWAPLLPGLTALRRLQPAQASAVLVTWGSHGGNAERVAQAFAATLRRERKYNGAVAVNARSLEDYRRVDWPALTEAYFVVSSYGRGELPPSASEFWRWLSGSPAPDLSRLRYAVLGLGDRRYREFCGGAIKLDARLKALGARERLPMYRADAEYTPIAQHWLRAACAERRGDFIPAPDTPIKPQPTHSLKLVARRRLTGPGAARACFHVELDGRGALTWRPGDQLLVFPPGCAAPRCYSIASSPSVDGHRIHLTVSRIGAGSTWLTGAVQIGESVPVALGTAPHFRLPADPRTPIVLIGAGSGIAPLRALLRERWSQPVLSKQWLLLGVRDGRLDAFYHDEWRAARSNGVLHHDVAESRAGACEYVQHRLARERKRLRRWIDAGAELYVSGNAGMGEAVVEVLHDEVARRGEHYWRYWRANNKLHLEIY